jgi:hypothetical protein
MTHRSEEWCLDLPFSARICLFWKSFRSYLRFLPDRKVQIVFALPENVNAFFCAFLARLIFLSPCFSVVSAPTLFGTTPKG